MAIGNRMLKHTGRGAAPLDSRPGHRKIAPSALLSPIIKRSL